MFDVQELKARHDLRRIVENDLGPSHGHGRKALRWRCPFHGEQKGYSLLVWADNWRCFGACGIGGDVIAWLQRYRRLSFGEACRWLGGEPVTVHSGRRSAHSPSPVSAVPPDLDWQQAAWRVVRQAVADLWRPVGYQALSYLKRRGLSGDTIAQAQLGFVPGRYGQWRTIDKFNVPCGITIPWFIGSELWAVKVRRAAGTPKYTQIAGGSASGLYNVDGLAGHAAVLFVEGEFDALLAQQECGGLCSVVTLGGASNTLSHSWLNDLMACRSILVAYDADEAGRKGAARLQALTSRAHVIRVPFGKDVTEFYLQGGSIYDWLTEALKTLRFVSE